MQSATPSPQRRALILAGVSAAAFIGPFSQTVYTPSLVEIGHGFGVDALRVNLTISLFVAILALSGFIVGPLADRKGRRATLLPGLALFVLGSVVCLMAQQYGPFLLGRALQAAGISTGIAMAAIVIGDLYPPEERAGAMSLYQLVTLLGPVVGPVVGGFIANHLHWQAAFTLLAVLGTAVLAYNALLLPETRPATPHQAADQSSASQVLANPSARAIFAVAFCQFYGYYTFLVFLPVLLGDLFQLPPAQRGLAFVPLTAGLLIGSSAVKVRAQQWRRTQIVNVASYVAAGTVLAVWALLALHQLTLPVLMALMLVYGLFVGGSLPSQTTILVNLFGASRGRAVGLYNTVRFSGAAAGPLAAAAVAAQFGQPAVFLVLGLGLGAAALVIRRHLSDPYEIHAAATPL